jgi:hypothetical protein
MDGQVKEASLIFEAALVMDFAGHQAVFDLFPELKSSTTLLALIETYRESN